MPHVSPPTPTSSLAPSCTALTPHLQAVPTLHAAAPLPELLARSQGCECSYFNRDAVYCLLPNSAREKVIKNQKASLSRVLHLMRFTPASLPCNPNSKPTCRPAGLRWGLQPPQGAVPAGSTSLETCTGLGGGAQPPSLSATASPRNSAHSFTL